MRAFVQSGGSNTAPPLHFVASRRKEGTVGSFPYGISKLCPRVSTNGVVLRSWPESYDVLKTTPPQQSPPPHTLVVTNKFALCCFCMDCENTFGRRFENMYLFLSSASVLGLILRRKKVLTKEAGSFCASHVNVCVPEIEATIVFLTSVRSLNSRK